MLQTFLKPLKGSQTPNKQHLALACSVPLAKEAQRQALVAAGLFPAYPLSGTSKPSTCGNYLQITCSSYQVALERKEAVADLGFQQSPFQEAPEPTQLLASFAPH